MLSGPSRYLQLPFIAASLGSGGPLGPSTPGLATSTQLLLPLDHQQGHSLCLFSSFSLPSSAFSLPKENIWSIENSYLFFGLLPANYSFPKCRNAALNSPSLLLILPLVTDHSCKSMSMEPVQEGSQPQRTHIQLSRILL